MLKIEELNLSWFSKTFISILIFSKAFSFEEAFCQSYVQNGSFEINADCPRFWSEKGEDFKGQFWNSPTKATPDLFASCSEQCNTKQNWIDKKVETEDDGYAGMILKQKNKSYTEYLQTKLIEPLKESSLYKVSMKIYWPENSKFGPVVPGVLFTSIPIDSKKQTYISSTNVKTPAIGLDTIVKNKWFELEIIYRAYGGEKYLTIGCFDQYGELKETTSGEFDFCYYFFDDISVEPFSYNYAKSSGNKTPNVISSFEYLDDVTTNHQPENCTCWNCMILSGKVDDQVTTLEEVSDFNLERGQRIDLNRVVFDYETGELKDGSNEELNRLLFVLEEQPKAELRFVIYTYPNDPDAQIIAKESAMKIYKYLKSRGLDNSFSYIHAEKTNMSQKDGIPRDRNVEMYVVNK